jgi:DNA-directed RNA polymerase beta subunit
MSANLPEDLREFDDTDKTRKLIYDNALDAVKRRFPVEDNDYRLELHDARYDGPQTFSWEQQKQALLRDRQLRTPIKGTWRLTHKETGAKIDEREDVVLHVPYYTPRGTFIYNGNEYTVANQSRLKPGPYVRRRRTGEVETQFNVRPGTGKSFHIRLEPETGIFRMNLDQSNIPLYPFLKAMGVEDKALQRAWGAKLLQTNIEKSDPRAVQKIYKRMSGYKYDPELDDAAQVKYLQENVPAFQLDPQITARTMGVMDTEGVTPELLLRATQKMLNVSRAEEEEDDRDNPMFSNVLSVEDFVEERIDKDAGRLARNLLFKARRGRNLKPIQRGALNPYMSGLLLNSGLAMPLEETNPLSTLEQLSRVTKLGEGGISSAESITDTARNVNNGQFGFIDPIAGPEGLNIGIDVRAAYKTFKGKDKHLYGEFKDTAGKIVYLRPDQVADAVVAFPGQLAKDGVQAVAMVRGQPRRVNKKDVDYEVPSFAHLMSANANLNPVPTGVQAGRQFYGAKFWSQYLPQVKGEVPLVDSLVPGTDQTFSEHYGRRIGSITAKKAGEVTRVTDKGVTVTDENGKKNTIELIKDFPFNRLTGISFLPAVKVGDQVNVGDMLAHSNFTDSKSGALTMGINLKTAVIPARGMSYEDAYVISESAAKKLSTERLYGYDQDARKGVTIGRNNYISQYPSVFTKQQVERVDSDGLVKPGTVVNFGDPLILATGPKLLSAEDAQFGRLHKVLRQAVTDKSVTWDHHYPGTVTDIAMTQRGAKVNVKAAPPVSTGDKLSTRYGLKGVVGHILKDDEMPRDPATNEPYEMLLNPMGVLSRVAPAQLIELALGKLAKKTGQPVRIPQDRPPGGWHRWARKLLAEAGIEAAEPVFDPVKGRTLKPVGTGYTYTAAFHHLADKKLSSRGEQGSYTLDDQPAKGGPTGAKRFSTMDVNATLAHGAPEIVRDALLIRGTKDEAYWKALKMGRPLPEPRVPFIYDKFINTLRAGGINVVDKGDTVSILPMIDDDVTRLSRGEIKSPKLLTGKYEAEPGGLFDLGKTGGTAGNRWTHITLPEPLPNPVMEEPIRRLLGLKKQEIRDIIAGRQDLNGRTGGAALKAELGAIDIDAQIEYHTGRAKRLRGANRDNSVKALGYLSAAKEQGLHPRQWMITRVPVIPPMFRPITRMGEVPLVPGINNLYQHLIKHKSNLAQNKLDLPRSALTDDYEMMYDAVSAVYGLGDPITPEGKAHNLKGAIRQVIGSKPKSGLFQSKVISKNVGGVGRGVVTPDPNLDMDSLGIPADSAWTLYKDFVMRRMVQNGYPPLKAVELIDERHPLALDLLTEEMKRRPVLVNRAPVWHKFNLMAFYPHIVEGDTIRVSPLITQGFTMDFDGDQANFHVPISEKAVKQAKSKMLPSRNLLSLTDLSSVRHSPTMEMTMGLYWLTQQAKKGRPVEFATLKDAKEAYRQGQINVNTPILIQG